MEKLRKVFRTIMFMLKYPLSKIENPKGLRLVGNGKRSMCSKYTVIKCTSDSEMTLGKITLSMNSNIVSIGGGNMRIGDNVFFNCNCMVVSRERITIGDNCRFGPNVCVIDHDHTFGRAKSNNDEYKKTPIEIGSNCWIGANVVILRGSKIGDNCVIGAGCVIKGEIPDNSIVKQDRQISVEKIEM